jgi:hypothetical protein
MFAAMRKNFGTIDKLLTLIPGLRIGGPDDIAMAA